jgi:2,4-dienoyl-CoA reductase-like NADH-dependent reductase (Old Yellow Enzyme family)
MDYKKFHYKSLHELKEEIKALGIDIKISNNMNLFKEKVLIGEVEIPNSLAIHPMEGGDSTEDGSPTSWTYRKYERMARGGAGLIWIEAVSVVEEGRSNTKQLMITEDNLDKFKELNDLIKNAAREEYGEDFAPLTIVQLNHSGRYSKPYGERKPIIATHNPSLDKSIGVEENYPLVEDDYLEELEDEFIKSAKLCKKAGFSGVDVKACHGYLLSELLSGFTRKGKYGGSYTNRTRFMLNVVDKIKKEVQDDNFIIAARLNLYDGLAYPYGWGVDKEDSNKMDLEEPIRLIKELVSKEVKLINVTMGNPYYIPHVNRPYDIGDYYPKESPLMSSARLIDGAKQIQKRVPEAIVVGVGYSWFREYAPYVAAGSLENGFSKLIGFGRESIAYPDFAKDILKNGGFDKKNVCISCSKCTDLKKAIGTCGCVIRDSKLYLPLYKEVFNK